MEKLEIALPEGKKLYFASDFHLGTPDAANSLKRERLLCRWLDSISSDAHTVFLLGDIFDFWFELYQRQTLWAETNKVPLLLAHFGTSLIEHGAAAMYMYFTLSNM